MKKIFLILFLLPLLAIGQPLANMAGILYIPPPAGPPSTNLWAYYESDNSATTAQWSDLSGNARHFTQPTSGNRPAYNSSVYTFSNNPTAQFMQMGTNITQPYAVYLIASGAFTGVQTLIWGDGITASGISFDPALGLVSASSDGTNTIQTASGSIVANTFYLIRVFFNGASSVIQVNNLSSTTGNAGTAGTTSGQQLGYISPASLDAFKIKAMYIYQGGDPNATLKVYTSAKYGLP